MAAEAKRDPVRRTREQLYAEVWATPISRLGINYGISGNGLAKICKRLAIPYPPRGYWARKAAGQEVQQEPLPPKKAGMPSDVVIVPSSPASRRTSVTSANEQTTRPPAAVVEVPQRLTSPHPIVARWIEEREQDRREARHRKRHGGIGFDPGEFTDVDRRRHRILSVLFKALESEGARISQSERGELVAEYKGEKIVFALRARNKQIRRPLNEDERRWSLPGDRAWRQELQPTGFLVFEFKTYIPEGRLRRPWEETDTQPIELMLGQIVAVFWSAWPLLAERTRQRLEDEERRRQEERRRYEEERRQKRNDNRWRRFVQLGHQRHDAEVARQLLRCIAVPPDKAHVKIGDLTMAEWLSWIEQQIQKTDPANVEPIQLFEHLAAITEYSQLTPHPSQ